MPSTAPTSAIPSKFNQLEAAGLLSRVVIALIIAALGMGGTILLANQPAWWNGFWPALLASALASAASVSILRYAWRGSLERAVALYFVASAARLLVSLGGCLIAILVGHRPAGPTLLMMLAFALAVLIVETHAILGSLRGAEQAGVENQRDLSAKTV